MSSTTWQGGVDNDPSNPSNWSAGLPSSTVDAVFSGTVGNSCNITQLSACKNLEIKSDFGNELITTGTATIDIHGYLVVGVEGKIKPTHAIEFEFQNAPTYGVFDSGGSAYAYKPHVVLTLNTGSMFANETARANTTFDFGSTTFTMIDGVYPKIEGSGTLYAKSIYGGTSRQMHNTYGSVDMLAVNGISVVSENFDVYDYDKIFNFEGALTSLGTNFKFGHTTAGFTATLSSGNVFPTIGETNSNAYGDTASNTFYSQFHKVVIRNGGTTNYYKINTGKILDCNELIIKDGGRLYGPSSGARAACIKTVKRPTVQGDWNFRQISDGIYESINDISNLPVSHGGTGLDTVAKGAILYGLGNGQLGVLPIGSTGQTLKVSSSGIPEWVT